MRPKPSATIEVRRRSLPTVCRIYARMSLTNAWGKAILRDTLSFNRKAFELGPTLRCLLGLGLVFALADLSGHWNAAPAMAMGAFNAGFTSLQGINRSRLGVMSATAIGMAAASCIGSLSAGSALVLACETLIAGYVTGVFSQLSRLAGVIALNTLNAGIIFSHVPLSPASSFKQALFLLAGAAIQILLLVVSWPFSRISNERRALSTVFANLARVAATNDKTSAPMAIFVAARQILADPQPFARASQIARLRRLLDDAYTVRKRLVGLQALDQSLSDEQRPAQIAVLAACGECLREVAATLDGTCKTEKPELDEHIRKAFSRFAETVADNPYATALGENTLVRLRDIVHASFFFATGRVHRFSFVAAARPNQYVESRIEWFSVIALRFALVMGGAMLLGNTLFVADRGYWIALTAALILKPDLHSTFVRGASRIFGTLIGACIIFGLIVSSSAHHSLEVYMLIAAGICYAALFANYTLFSTAVTAYTICYLTLLGTTPHDGLSNRIIDTCIGGALAMLGYLCFPTWAHARTREVLADMIDAQADFAVILLDGYIGTAKIETASIEEARTHLWKLRTDAEALVDRTRSEPQRPHSIDAERALAILAALQRFSLVNLAIENNRETLTPQSPETSLEPFRNALHAEMKLCASALRERSPSPTRDERPGLQELLQQETAAAILPNLPFMRMQLRAYAQSIAELRKLCL
jgi:uncharacterized membrane protein YccC